MDTCVINPAAVSFAVLLPTLLVAHHVADHWVQTERQAMRKGLPGWPGRLACLDHVASYVWVCTVAVAGVWWLFDLPITTTGVLTGQAISAVTHYFADRRAPLAWLARLIGKGGFFTFGTPRPGHDDNPSLGSGAYALDQSWHWLWLGVAAAVTAVMGGAS